MVNAKIEPGTGKILVEFVGLYSDVAEEISAALACAARKFAIQAKKQGQTKTATEYLIDMARQASCHLVHMDGEKDAGCGEHPA